MRTMKDIERFQINEDVFNWCVKGFSWLEKHLGINIKVHSSPGLLSKGQIFLFNHFARFETIVPPYLIFRQTGAHSRIVADHHLFEGNESFANFLKGVGALPNDLPQLMPFLAAELLRGRKVVVFPEGGMIKDRRVLDASGDYNVYSPTSKERRKHHRGAAVIAQTLDTFKQRILSVHKMGDMSRLERWRNALGLDSVETLLARAREPTLIVPANITFYPLRVADNILNKSMEMLFKDMSDRLSEELLVEGNILLKDTDMDIRFGEPIKAHMLWRWWERRLLNAIFKHIDSLEDLFSLRDRATRWDEKMLTRSMCNETLRIRDEYMRSMYSRVTMNFSHVAARMVVELIGRGRMNIGKDEFHKALYLALKSLQNASSLYLHESLLNPERYRGVLEGESPGLKRFLRTSKNAGLIGRTPRSYRFMTKLRQEHEFNEIRIENPILVYANEIAPLAEARATITAALDNAASVQDDVIASDLFDDELRAFAWNLELYREPDYSEINDMETATESGEPFLLLPKEITGAGVVMVHGFLASPAELRPFAEKLVMAGHPVIGVRLAGHGTSPWDLRERQWSEWLDSVRRGFSIMTAFAEKVAIVGFSTGGALALRLASEEPKGLAGVAAANVSMRFKDRRMIFVPLIHGINKLTQWLPSFEGVMPFSENDSEHPEINYKNMPVRALYELRQM
ncbi:MAG TPA: alpha/beta fold hydrolase, partial [Rhodospirillales bacterium]|nr:alpha/beta fold hydrolase [Rhodospirillales bacterium]